MKQLLVLLFLVSSMACFGQNKDALKDISLARVKSTH